MQSFFGILYAVMFLIYIGGGIFIVYHLFRYSPTRIGATISATLFLSVFLVLLFTNGMLFFMLPLDSFFPGIDIPSIDLTSGSTGFGPFSR
jgi:Na+-driven multidrug efflux pump